VGKSNRGGNMSTRLIEHAAWQIVKPLLRASENERQRALLYWGIESKKAQDAGDIGRQRLAERVERLIFLSFRSDTFKESIREGKSHATTRVANQNTGESRTGEVRTF
jgi:hypothetical protein